MNEKTERAEATRTGPRILKNGGAHPKKAPKGKEERPRSFWVAAASTLLLMLSIASNVVTVWGGPFWPTAPALSPSYPSAANPFALPINIENKSAFFAISNVELTCNILNMKDSRNNTFFNITSKRSVSNQFISEASAQPISCDSFNIPWQTIQYAELQIDYSYDSPWPYGARVHKTSPVFYFNPESFPPRWTIGKPLR